MKSIPLLWRKKLGPREPGVPCHKLRARWDQNPGFLTLLRSACEPGDPHLGLVDSGLDRALL